MQRSGPRVSRERPTFRGGATNLTKERPLPFTKTSKPSTEGAFFASRLVIVIFHTKLSPGRLARSASRTMSAASSPRAGEAVPSRRTSASASLDMTQGLHDVEASGAPGGIERGERRGDDRQTEGLRQHRRNDEDLDREPSGGTRRRRQLDADGGDELREADAEADAQDPAGGAQGDALEDEHRDDAAPPRPQRQHRPHLPRPPDGGQRPRGR